jgi:pSer/pThr/pTyr-binding forkhead associated (FHA) protein
MTGMTEPDDREFGVSDAVEAEPEATDTFDPIDHARVIRQREAAAGIPELTGYALVVTDGPRQGAHWVLNDGPNEAGRNAAAFIVLDDITVSRHHAEFIVARGRLEIRDLGSTNGTYVNGKRAERSELHPGDEVIIGRFHLVVAFGT